MRPPVPVEPKLRFCDGPPAPTFGALVWLQGISLGWMLVECGVSLYAANAAHSAALLAFGSDSLVELLSVMVASLSLFPGFPLKSDRTDRWAGVLLFVLAGVIAITASLSLIYGIRPATSWVGVGISGAALIVMPVLAWLKRRFARANGNRALAADAVQSATCAYLAAITLTGLMVNALFHIRWVDSIAALGALPILFTEGRRAMRGDPCGCR